MEPRSCCLCWGKHPPGLQGRSLGTVTTSDVVVKIGVSTIRTFCTVERQKSSFVLFVWDISVALLSIYRDLVLLNKSCVSSSMLLPGRTHG